MYQHLVYKSGKDRVGANKHIPIRQGAQFTRLSSPTHIHTRTHTVLLCCHSLFLLYLSVLSFRFQEKGGGESFANWFLQKKRIRSPLSPQYPRALFLLDDSPVSCSCQLSRAFTRLVIPARSVNLQSCRGFKNTSPRPGIQSVERRASVAIHLSSTDIIYDFR